ncbi:MAG: SIS domain-containing protein [Gemmatimonadota bacterium]|nr:SIS domain-containing protein [Gemmatimonadota bacterium]
MHHDKEGLDLMERDIERQSEVLAASLPGLRAEAEATVRQLRRPPQRVYLVGCGDSLDAGLSARFVWERMLGVAVEAVPAMTFASSVISLVPPASLVVALSQSGKVSRVVEGIRAARARGLPTMTITADPQSPLAREPSDATFVIDFSKVGQVPGTTSHLLGILALYELACAFSKDKGEVIRLREAMDGVSTLVWRAGEIGRTVATDHASVFHRDTPFLSIGYGPGLAVARFTVRKFLELTQLLALWQETEEYAHDEYSLVGSQFCVLQVAPPGRGLARSIEIAQYLRRLDAHVGVVTDESSAYRFSDAADVVYALPETHPDLVPLVYSVPGQILSVLVARLVGGSLYGMAERIHREDGDPQIYESEIVVG